VIAEARAATGGAEAAHGSIPFLEEALLFLSVGLVVVLVLHRLRLSPVLGFLLAGMAIGPSAFDLAPEIDTVRAVAELGVVFLMFVIGLDLSVERFRALGRWVFGLGTAQVVSCALVIGAVALAWGNPPAVAVLLGVGLALSSTAVVVQLLVERGEVAAPHGRIAFSVLLLQDLAVVPLLVLVPMLGDGGAEHLPTTLGLAVAKAAFAVAAIWALGRWALGPLFARAAATRSPDVLTAAALFVVLGTAWATHALGLSAALGAFLGGMALAGSAFRHHVEADIQPFKGLLLGLFFLTVGMTVDLGLILGSIGWLVPAVIGMMVIKGTLIVALARAFGAPRDAAVRAGVLLAEAGEFAFVVLGAALATGVIESATAQFMFAVVGLSIMATPFLPALADRIVARLPPAAPAEAGAPPVPGGHGPEGHVVVAGFGRVGRTVVTFLSDQQVPWIAVDLDAARVRAETEAGRPVVYGDASRPDILRALGIDRAAAVVLTIDDPAAAERTLEAVRRMRPDMTVFARARDREAAHRLKALGAAVVVPETFESGLALAGQALAAMGVPGAAVEEVVVRLRTEERIG
jgi:monovalent cation:H+ antiporter-2, CPA2 family